MHYRTIVKLFQEKIEKTSWHTLPLPINSAQIQKKVFTQRAPARKGKTKKMKLVRLQKVK